MEQDTTIPGVARHTLTRVLGRPPREAEVQDLRRSFIARLEASISRGLLNIAAQPGTAELLAQARERSGFTVAFVSGNWTPAAALTLQAARLIADDVVTTSADDADSWPGILRAAQTFAAAGRGIPGFSRTIVIGSDVSHAQAARKIRAGCIALAADAGQALRLRTEGAGAVVPHYRPPEAFWAAVDAVIDQLHSTRTN